MDQFLGSIKATLVSLLERYTGAEITDKLCSSILATLFRQQVQCSLYDLIVCLVLCLFFLPDFTLDLCFLADHFTSGAVLSGHSSQFTANELLISG